MVISGVISPLIWFISKVTRLITPLITTHEPPSKPRMQPLRLAFGRGPGMRDQGLQFRVQMIWVTDLIKRSACSD